jgi:nitric oxide synthase-interacting protein
MTGESRHNLPSFWVPSQTPDSGRAKIQKPDSAIYCPMSGKVLKMKDLIDVKFTLADTKTKQSLVGQQDPYICAVTKDTLTNSMPLAVLRPTGDVVTMDCVEKVIKKDMLHPLTSQKLAEKDIILLQRGGTGFASANEKLQAKKAKPALQCC